MFSKIPIDWSISYGFCRIIDAQFFVSKNGYIEKVSIVGIKYYKIPPLILYFKMDLALMGWAWSEHEGLAFFVGPERRVVLSTSSHHPSSVAKMQTWS